ncbi:MAG: 4-(cytidine 5'-diphospho)-2-C-methyl-D-erythritol kinase [Ferruginibacter sp.]
MLFFSNAKINIGLNILGKRSVGYHELETVFYPVHINDAVEIIENYEGTEDIIFTATGNSINVTAEDNLCVKAYRVVKNDFPLLPAVKMHLHKNIPTGAGLGGGSSNAVAVLRLLDKKFNLQISEEKLLHYALLLGSDCPFFVLNTPCIAKGRGELLTKISLNLSAYSFMIVNPGIHINTGEAFALLDQGNFSTHGTLEKAIEKDIRQWKNTVINDLEEPVCNKYPVIKDIKDNMYASGAIYSSMSGSGSSVYGIFEKNAGSNVIFPSHWFCQMV